MYETGPGRSTASSVAGSAAHNGAGQDVLGLEFGRAERAPLRLKNGPIMLRPGEPRDAAAWIDTREASRAHLTRWEPDWRSADLTVDAVKTRLRAQSRMRREPSHISLFVFRRTDNALVGGVTLSAIRYHAARSAQIGYWIGARHVRQGYARAAVEAVIAHAFDRMGLNRIEAACQPTNVASRRVLAGAGFRQEGYARDYLFINGAWRDHCLYAITAADAALATSGGHDVPRFSGPGPVANDVGAM